MVITFKYANEYINFVLYENLFEMSIFITALELKCSKFKKHSLRRITSLKMMRRLIVVFLYL